MKNTIRKSFLAGAFSLAMLGGVYIQPAHAGYWSAPVYNVTCRLPYQLNVEHANGGGGTMVGSQLSNGLWTYLIGGFFCRGTIKATFTWIDDPNDPNDAPPSSVTIREGGYAMYKTLILPGPGPLDPEIIGSKSDLQSSSCTEDCPDPDYGDDSYADNGMGDAAAPVYTGTYVTGYMSHGSHDLSYSVVNGTVTTREVTLKAYYAENSPADPGETQWNWVASILPEESFSSSSAPLSEQSSNLMTQLGTFLMPLPIVPAANGITIYNGNIERTNSLSTAFKGI